VVATLHIREVPDEIQHGAKVAAAQRRQPLREWVIEAMTEKLERERTAAQDVEQ